MAGNDRKPAAPLFLHTDDGCSNVRIWRGTHSRNEGLAIRALGEFEKRQMIGV
jgi:hypothetical protein